MSEDESSRRAGEAFARLVAVMARLRGPDGCPWDREQDMRSLRPYTLEEAYEVVEAIDEGDRDALVGELGDLLLQIVFLSRIAAEDGDFTAADVADSIVDKLVRRHPHVFGEVEVDGADEVTRNWEEIKHGERGGGSVMDDIPGALPALMRAEKLGKRASRIGFDWPDPGSVLGKVHEELEELEEAMETAAGEAADERGLREVPRAEVAKEVEEELGDVLATLVSLGRRLGISAEVALRRANDKFEDRFRELEEAVAAGRVGSDPEELEAAWERIKVDAGSPERRPRRRRGTAAEGELPPGTGSEGREG